MHDLTEIMHKAPQVPLRVDAALRLEFPTGHDVRPHHHQTWELVYFLEGDARCPTGDGVVEGHPGTLLLTPPRTSHHEIVDGPWACYCIEIDAPPDHPWPRVYHDDANGTFANLCSILVREWTGQQPGRDGMIALLLAQFDILLQRTYEHDQQTTQERLVREVERLLEERYARSITIQEIAKEVGVAPSTLRLHFLRMRGRTPMAYLQGIRIQHALALIHNSDVSLETIASLCGYDSASHLSRHVMRATGKRPGTFRVK